MERERATPKGEIDKLKKRGEKKGGGWGGRRGKEAAGNKERKGKKGREENEKFAGKIQILVGGKENKWNGGGPERAEAGEGGVERVHTRLRGEECGGGQEPVCGSSTVVREIYSRGCQ